MVAKYDNVMLYSRDVYFTKRKRQIWKNSCVMCQLSARDVRIYESSIAESINCDWKHQTTHIDRRFVLISVQAAVENVYFRTGVDNRPTSLSCFFSDTGNGSRGSEPLSPHEPLSSQALRQNVIPSVPRLSADSKDASQTRSTGPVHTSAKARLTTVAIRIQIPDPDRHQNVTFFRWLIANLPWKFYANPLRSFAQSCQQTKKQTTTTAYPPWRR